MVKGRVFLLFALCAAPLAVGADALAQSSTPPGGGAAQAPAPKRAPDVPFVPTEQDVVNRMLDLAGVDRDDLLYDLGSGDGRIVITAAKERGARGVGVDINPVRIAESQQNARKARVQDRVRFVEGDLFTADLSGATAVTLYLLPEVNLKLRPRLLAELRPGTPVVSHDFDMGEWKPDRTVTMGNDTVYLWVVPAQVAGTWTVAMGGAGQGREAQLNLQQQFQVVGGSARMGGKRLALSDVTLRGDELSFKVAGAPEGRLRFHGKVSGDAMQGTVTPEGRPGGARPFTATRRTAGAARR